MQISATLWHHATGAPDPFLEVSGHLQLPTGVGGTQHLPRTQLWSPTSPYGGASRAMWGSCRLSVLLQAEGRAGFCDQIKTCFFAKAIPKPQIPGTVPQSSQEGWEHSWCHPNLPFPAREFADLPFTLQTRRKKWDFCQFGDVSPGMAPSSRFLQCPVAACCSPGSSALQAGRQAWGMRQFSVLQ